MTNLKKLSINKDYYNEIKMTTLSKFKLKNLIELNLQGCDIEFIDDSFFKNNNQIIKLDLSCNRNLQFTYLIKSLQYLNKLEILDLSGCDINDSKLIQSFNFPNSL